MKKNALNEYKGKLDVELEKELRSLKEKMVNLKMDIETGKVKSLKEMKDIKKSIAQFETILNERKKSL